MVRHPDVINADNLGGAGNGRDIRSGDRETELGEMEPKAHDGRLAAATGFPGGRPVGGCTPVPTP